MATRTKPSRRGPDADEAPACQQEQEGHDEEPADDRGHARPPFPRQDARGHGDPPDRGGHGEDREDRDVVARRLADGDDEQDQGHVGQEGHHEREQLPMCHRGQSSGGEGDGRQDDAGHREGERAGELWHVAGVRREGREPDDARAGQLGRPCVDDQLHARPTETRHPRDDHRPPRRAHGRRGATTTLEERLDRPARRRWRPRWPPRSARAARPVPRVGRRRR